MFLCLQFHLPLIVKCPTAHALWTDLINWHILIGWFFKMEVGCHMEPKSSISHSVLPSEGEEEEVRVTELYARQVIACGQDTLDLSLKCLEIYKMYNLHLINASVIQFKTFKIHLIISSQNCFLVSSVYRYICTNKSINQVICYE